MFCLNYIAPNQTCQCEICESNRLRAVEHARQLLPINNESERIAALRLLYEQGYSLRLSRAAVAVAVEMN